MCSWTRVGEGEVGQDVPKILVADDEPGIRAFIRGVLENEHYEVVEASDGEEAIRSFFEERPDLVVLDRRMPGLDGDRVLSRLRETSEIPVIVLSALTSVPEKAACLDIGADDYVTKPISRSELLARVQAVLRRTMRNPPTHAA